MHGFIKLYRKLLDNPIFQNEKLLKVFIWCLLKATHKEYEQLVGLQSIPLTPGQFIFGRYKDAQELKINPNSLKKYVKWLADNGYLTTQSTNKYTVVTVVNWALYQVNEPESTTKNTDNVPTEYQQNTTNKNNKNNKNNILSFAPYDEIVSLYHKYCNTMPSIKTLTDQRKRAMAIRFKKFGSLGNFEELFQKAGASDFLSGRNGRWTACNFDWLLTEKNMVSVLEGKYDNKEQVTRGW